VRSFTSPLTIGLFGSGCDEYVYQDRLSGAPCVSTARRQRS
jgi:hypothetical protein